MIEKLALEQAKSEGVALTFDDVRLKTGYSEILPDHVNVSSMFSRNVNLKIPVVSAAMDTVTEYRLAIELAKLGGLGIIHRNFSIDRQGYQVARVKNHLHGFIEKPVKFREDAKVSEVLEVRVKKDLSFYNFPVLDGEGKLVGIVSGNDFEFCSDNSLPVGDIMSKDLLTAPEGTTIDQAYEIMKRAKKKSLPVLSEDGKLVGMYTFSDVKRIKTGSAEMYNVDNKGRLRVGAAVGVGDEALRRVECLIDNNVDVIVIDTAHGDTKSVLGTLKRIKSDYLNLEVVVGNVSSGDSAKRLVDAGADGVKVGQGPGSICTTRIIAGIGVPQVSAVYDCAYAIGDEVPVCADGGIKNSGDIPIAIAAGAHSVMMGGMLAGVEESPGERIFFKGSAFKSYRGMGSIEAMQESDSSRERYLQVERSKSKLIPEGIEGLVPYRGKLEDVLFQYVGGLRRGMGYVGAKSVDELREKGDFVRITGAGVAESHPHDIQITKDSPNYIRDN